MDALFARTRALIDIPSVTGSEKRVGDFVAGLLAELGFEPGTQTVSDDRRNVFAVHGEPRVVLCTHMDTVGPHIPSSEDASWIHGRGACDAKGILAAMLSAAERLKSRGQNDFAVLFVVGEETTSDGARATTELGWPTEAVIVGEPTDGVLVNGHKGMVAARIHAQGRAAHSGYPELGESAIDRLMDVLTDLRQASWGEDARLGAGTVNVGTISGGVAGNVIPAEAEALVTWRVADSCDSVREQLSRIVAQRDHITVTELGASEPVQCSTVDGWPSKSVAFGTDLPWLKHLGRPYLVGPGSIHEAHTGHERVPKSELVEAVSLYERLVVELLGGGEC